MGRIVIEFGTPNAKVRARDWKKEIAEAVTAAVLNLKSNDTRLFTEQEFSVYYTFHDKDKDT